MFPEYRAFYEIIWKNVAEPEGTQMTSQYGHTRYMMDKQGYTHAYAYTNV
jgi:hypothetical protein